jgi:hypothetical protein
MQFLDRVSICFKAEEIQEREDLEPEVYVCNI